MSEVYWRDLRCLLRFYPNHQPWGATCAQEYIDFIHTLDRQYKFEDQMELYRENASDLPWEIFRMVLLMTGLHLSDHHYPLTFHGMAVYYISGCENVALQIPGRIPYCLENIDEDEETRDEALFGSL
jgi:hypothetical protein